MLLEQLPLELLEVVDPVLRGTANLLRNTEHALSLRYKGKYGGHSNQIITLYTKTEDSRREWEDHFRRALKNNIQLQYWRSVFGTTVILKSAHCDFAAGKIFNASLGKSSSLLMLWATAF